MKRIFLVSVLACIVTIMTKAESADGFSFIYLSDENQVRGHLAIENAYTKHPDLELIFTIPDNGWSGQIGQKKAARQAFFDRYANQWRQNPNADLASTPIFVGLGNHDIEYPEVVDWHVTDYGPTIATLLPGMENFREGPYDVYSEHGNYEDRYLTYSFDYKNAHFIVLNIYFHDILLGEDRLSGSYSPKGSIHADLLTWIEDDLKNTNAEFKFLFYHEGAYPAPGERHNGDSLDAYPAERDAFWHVLAQYGVTATFVGHDHSTSHVWSNDPNRTYGAVLELEPGYVGTNVKSLVVSIENNIVTFRNYGTSPGKYDFHEVRDPIIYDISPDAPNYKVKLYQHYGGYEQGYPIIDKNLHLAEVGETLNGHSGLYFTAKDHNINDNIKFSFANLPGFMTVNDWTEQHRRIRLDTSALTEGDIGDHDFDVIASDGMTQDTMGMTLSVVPSELPVVTRFSIENNSVHKKLKRIFYYCRDNVKLALGRAEQLFSVKINGVQAGGWSRHSRMFTDDFAFIGVYAQDGSVGFLPGEYEITATTRDRKGQISEPNILKFTIAEDSTLPDETPPWVEGIYPFDGSSVKTLSRVSLWLNTFIGTFSSLAEYTEVNVLKDGQPVEFIKKDAWRDMGETWGEVDVVFDAPLEKGEYVIEVTPVAARSWQNFVRGDTRSFTITVTEGGSDEDPNPKPEPDPDPDPEPEPEPEPKQEAVIPAVTALNVYNNIIKPSGNNSAVIVCDMHAPGKLTVVIYNAKGKEIIILADGNYDAGSHSFSWSGVDASSNKVGSGIYIVHMKTGGYTETKKIAAIK